MNDAWTSGTAYEVFMGRWSARVARKFLDWLAVPPDRTWLDVGCGTGALTRLILEAAQPREVFAIDPSAEFISHAQHVIADARARFRVGEAQSLQLDSDSVDAAVCGLVLNFVPQPEAALSEMLRVVKPEGRIGIFVWDYADGMQMLRYFWDAAAALDPRAAELDEGRRFPICRAGQLEALVRAAGLKEVEAAPIEVPTVFQNFDDYWQPFLGKVGPAPAYAMGLDPAARRALEYKLRELLPIDSDGSISLVARAWAVKGTA